MFKIVFQLLTILPFISCFGSAEIPINSTAQLPLPSSMLYRAHPWHGPSLGEKAPDVVNCYVEIAPISTLKFEMDKETGLLMVDRPHKYASFCPTLYGFLPRTYAGKRVGEYTSQILGNAMIEGDGDAIDVCILTENVFSNGDIIVKAIPIGGFRMIDTNEADDKIIAVLEGDAVYGNMKDITECPEKVIEQLRHFFLTYKEIPQKGKEGRVQITHIYGRDEAHEVIQRGYADYLDYISPSVQ
jgi:inorganic pyrophosphatase